MQKCSRQIVKEQELNLELHLIGIVVRILVNCGGGFETDRNTRYGKNFCDTSTSESEQFDNLLS